MSQFFWTAGHLGWAFFALLLFTGIWWLAADLAWRLKQARLKRLAMWAGLGWIAGLVLIFGVAGAW